MQPPPVRSSFAPCILEVNAGQAFCGRFAVGLLTDGGVTLAAPPSNAEYVTRDGSQ